MTHLASLRTREAARFVAANPRSQAAAAARASHWHQGVPFHWMRDWPSPFPLVAAQAVGATLTSLDGQTLDDFCLADTAAMFGHSPAPLAAAISQQARVGLGYMLPSPEVGHVGALLAERYGLPYWQTTTTASEANRAVIRWARQITQRRKILVFNGCYHGAVDDVFVDLRDGIAETRQSLVGQVHDIREHSLVVEFNDLDGLSAALAGADVACVLAEPVMTNVGMVQPLPGYLQELRRLTSLHGTLLVWDETHTISSGWSGHSGTYGPPGDMMVIGKSIGGGVPCAVYGFTESVSERMIAARKRLPPGHSGIGTTLSANALAIAALRAMLDQVMSRSAYAHMLDLAGRLAEGIGEVTESNRLPWHVTRVGARVELICAPTPSRNGSEARAVMHPKLESLLHLMLVNRGSLLAPFHNMMLISPATSRAAVSRLIANLDDCLQTLSEHAS